MNVPRTVEAFTELVGKGEWAGGASFPPAPGGGPRVPTGALAPPPHKTHSTDGLLAIDLQKLPADMYRVLSEHLYATGIIVIFGFLMGVLSALICCFPNPKIVMLQSPSADSPSGPKIKEE